MKQKAKIKRWIKRCFLAGLLLTPFVVGTAWMLFQHIPAWYTPPVVHQDHYQRVRDDLLETEDLFTHRLMASKPFTFTLRDTQINEWIATRHAIWKPAAKWIPPQIQNPLIRFQPGRLILAGLVRYDDAKVIASAHLSAEIQHDKIRLALRRVQAGSLPLPTSWLVEKLIQHTRNHTAKDLGVADASPDHDEIFRQLAALPDGAFFANRVTWPNGRRDFVIDSIAFGRGTCTLRVRPLAPAYSTR